MSKRKAEDILPYCLPSKRFISIFVDYKSVDPLISRDNSTKRKLQAEEGQDSEPDPGRLLEPECKRLESARRGPEPRDRSARLGHSWAPGARGLGVGEPRDTCPTSSSLTGTARRAGPPENASWDEVPCQYNSFQFWRVPLPTVQVAEIEDFGQLKTAEEMNCEGPEEAGDIEMELQN
uniref:uncharacterized protein C9orf40-like n=1 Tax=Pristiophorus japonicus TaxID=55135 RepID=UPI00398F83DE